MNSSLSTTSRNIVIQTWQRHTALRFATSGVLGNVIFFGLDTLLFPLVVRLAVEKSSSSQSTRRAFGNIIKWIGDNAASVSFFVAYLLDIFVQHFLNALMVFGLDTIRTKELYLSSLSTAYTA